jgi:hypothetical protein
VVLQINKLVGGQEYSSNVVRELAAGPRFSHFRRSSKRLKGSFSNPLGFEGFSLKGKKLARA